MNYYLKSRNKWNHLLALHVLLGVAIALYRPLATYWALATFAWFLYRVLATRNKAGIAHLGAAYIIGQEVFLRMAKANLFWEYGKLTCMTLFAAGIVANPNKKYRTAYLIIPILLIPSVIQVSSLDFSILRQYISFQLGGLFLLALASTYFSAHQLSELEIQDIFRCTMLPIVAMTTYLFLASPSLAETEFRLSANFAATAGYGPNQVSTILGLGLLFLSLNFLLRLPPLFSTPVDIALIGALSFRGLLTFSRGGIAGYLVGIAFAYMRMPSKLRDFRIVGRIIAILFVIGACFLYINDLSGNLLLARFEGKTTRTLQDPSSLDLNAATTGRINIISSDIRMWYDHFLFGVGVGQSKPLRPNYGATGVAHTEHTRLLAEHGLLGLIVLVIIIVISINRCFKGTHLKAIAVQGALILFTQVTMLHSATRLALVGYCFGLALASLQVRKHHA